ncbi:MAG: hypothetical protein AAGK37_21865 [Pseudomonadota bacterium]
MSIMHDDDPTPPKDLTVRFKRWEARKRREKEWAEQAVQNAPRVAPRIDEGKLAQDIARRKAKAKAESAAIEAELRKIEGEPDHIPSKAEIRARKARAQTSGYGFPDVLARKQALRRKAGLDD